MVVNSNVLRDRSGLEGIAVRKEPAAVPEQDNTRTFESLETVSSLRKSANVEMCISFEICFCRLKNDLNFIADNVGITFSLSLCNSSVKSHGREV